MAKVAPDPINPDPGDIVDPPAQVSPDIKAIKDSLKGKWASQFTNQGLNPNNYQHPIRIILQDGTPDRSNYVQRSGSYQSIKNQKPKKTKHNLKVDSGCLTIKRNMLTLAQSALESAKQNGLQGDWRVIIRIAALSGGAPDDNNCGCGCTTGPAP